MTQFLSIGYSTLNHNGNPLNLENMMKALWELTNNNTKIFLDTARIGGNNNGAIGRVFNKYPDMRQDFFICTKIGINYHPTCIEAFDSDSIRQQCEESLLRLNTDYLDLVLLSHVTLDIEYEIVKKLYKVLVDLQSEGKIKSIGLSKCPVFYLALLATENNIQYVEYSLNPFDKRLENDIKDIIKKYQIKMLISNPYPGKLMDPVLLKLIILENYSKEHVHNLVSSALELNDDERNIPYYSIDNICPNLICIKKFTYLAKKMNLSAIQLSLSYFKTKGFVPILSTLNIEETLQNITKSKMLGPVTMDLIDTIAYEFNN